MMSQGGFNILVLEHKTMKIKISIQINILCGILVLIMLTQDVKLFLEMLLYKYVI